jgi:pimeloyl-ACP methyl ester carboxylesterase
MTNEATAGSMPAPRTRTTATGIAYEVSGSGDPVVLIHGYPLDRSAMADVGEILARSHTVLNPDLRGFGASRTPIDGDLSMERHADDLALLLDEEGIAAATMIGLSMGGYVALAFAERHPGRLTALGLVGSKTESDSAEGKEGRDSQAAQILAQGRESIVAGFQSALLGEDAPSLVRGRLRTMIEATRYETYVAALAAMRDRPDRSSVLADLDVPVAVVAGGQDPLVPPAVARAVADRARNGSLTIVPRAGHLVTMEDPKGVVEGLASILED